MVFCGFEICEAQIAAWDFTGVGGTTLPTYAATTFNANLVSAAGWNNITRGATAAWSTGANSFRTAGFQNNGIVTSNTDYFQVTLQANPTYTLSLSTIDARVAGTATYCATPGASQQFAYSLDGTTFTLIGSQQTTLATPFTLSTINLSGIAALQNVSSTTIIYLRFYASGQTTTGGWGFNSLATAGTNGLAIGGTVSPSGGTATLSNITQPSGTILQGATNVVLAGFAITPTVSVNFSAITITSSGTATATDISNVRIFKDIDGNGAINGADAQVTGPTAQAYAASMNFSGITSETGLTIATNYLVVADVSGVGVSTPGNTVTVSSNSFTTTAASNVGSFTGNSRTIAIPPGTSTITAGPAVEPTTISSLINTQGASVLNFDFTITDDGVTPATDGAASQISQIILNAGIGNAVTNWATAIAGVELSDGTNSTTVATIGTSSITFSGISNAAGQLGYIADNAAKTYTLKIWLNTNLGALSTVIDGKDFVFRVQTADFTIAGSQLANGQDQNSGDGNNTVTVTATNLAFVTQPPANTSVNVGMTPVTVSANDVNGNRDLDYTGLIDITSTGTLNATPITNTSVAGLATFNSITHTVVGAGLTLNAERNGTLDWDVVSNLFNITAVTTYTWIGGNGLWTVAGNWNPTRTTPDPSDILQFNDGATVTVTDVPTQTIGSLLISGNTLVSLQAPGVNTLTIGGATGTFLNVGLGSELNSTGANVLTILLASGATGSITGNMNFSGAAHRFNATDANAVNFHSPSVFTQGTGCSGSVFTATGTQNVMVFGTGTTFLQITGSNPFGLGSPASKVVFSSGSLFKFQQNAAPSFSGRTYANLEIDNASFSQSATGASVLSIDNLTMTQGTLNLNLTGGINIKGNIVVATGQTLTFIPATTNTITFNGSSVQNINSTGTLSFGPFANITINNSNGVNLNTPITLNGILTLTSGNITSTVTNLLSMSSTASVTGASNTSFVSGPVAKTGATGFVFPVGKTGTGYVAVEIANLSGSETFTAEYMRGDALSLGTISANGLLNVSRCEYWILNRAGSATANVTLYWTSVNNCSAAPYITNLLNLTIAHFDGVGRTWDAFAPAANTTGTTAAGTVTWSDVSIFSPFTLGSVSFINPLAISLNYLRGVKQGNTHLLNWKVTCASTPSATLSLERSADGISFKPIYSITADALRCAQPFEYSDAQPVSGTNYYRLKMIDANGKISYSNIITLINASQGFDIMHIAPNPVTGNNFNLNISSAKATQMNIVISDLQGRVVKQASLSLIAGYNTSEINIQSLAPGTYQLYGSNGTDKSKLIRFVKQ